MTKSTPATAESTPWNARILVLFTTGFLSARGGGCRGNVRTGPSSVNVTLHATSLSLRPSRGSFCSIFDASARIRLTSSSVRSGTPVWRLTLTRYVVSAPAASTHISAATERIAAIVHILPSDAGDPEQDSFPRWFLARRRSSHLLSARVPFAAALPGCLFLLQSPFQSNCFSSQDLIDARIPGQFPEESPV